MSGKTSAVILIFTVLLLANTPVFGDEVRRNIVFVGDVLLARNVEKEIQQRKVSPWADITQWLKESSQVIGNFEGAVGTVNKCVDNANPCFAVNEDLLKFPAQAGFTALGVENNHSEDLGQEGKIASERTLSLHGIRALTFKDSPWYFKVGHNIVAVIAYNEVEAGNAIAVSLPNVELAQKIKLAHQLANMVVVYVHWGNELQDWPSERQRAHAHWLIEQGADMVVGHHPHVIQGEECIDGHPVIYSLGNHLFDQKYPITKTGQLLECDFQTKKPICRLMRSETPANSAFPDSIQEDISASSFWVSCQPHIHPFPKVADATIIPQLRESISSESEIKLEFNKANLSFTLPAPGLMYITPTQFGNGQEDSYLLTLEPHYSPLDKTTAPRPYVYSVGQHGLNAKWRGSALAWPLLDITIVRNGGIDYLCALHRGDSFLAPDPDTHARRVQVYKWNGFGFSALESSHVKAECENSYSSFLEN